MKKVAITGATGFLANELVEHLLSKEYEINAIARNEGKLVALKKKYPSINIFPCPIEDKCLLKKALINCEGVFHLASFKDVVLAENNPTKTIQTNLLGTLNVLYLSNELENIKFVITTSTDKAVKVSGVYGASKMIVEKLFHEFDIINGNKCNYRLVRYGNIFYSTGSVLPKWKESLLNDKEIIITDPNATRYFLTANEAVNLIMECLNTRNTTDAFYPKMKSIEIGKLLNLMIKKYAIKKPFIKEIGLRQGENMHEYINSELNSSNAERWTEQELMKIL